MFCMFLREFPLTLLIKWVFLMSAEAELQAFSTLFSHTLSKVRRDWSISSLLFSLSSSSALFFHLRVYSESLLRPPSWRSWKRLWTAGCWTCRSTQPTLTPSQVSSQISLNLLPWQPDYLQGKKWLLIAVCFWVVLHGDTSLAPVAAVCCAAFSSKQNKNVALYLRCQ